MSTLPQILFWCTVQVTLFAGVTLIIGAIFSRRGPAAGALVAVGGLAFVIGLTAAAFSPWPSWAELWSAVPSNNSPVLHTQSASLDHAGMIPANRSPADQQEASVQSRTLNWSGLATGIYLVGIALALIWMTIGLAAIREYRRESTAIEDRQLLESRDALSRAFRCRRNVEVRELPGIGTPATIGWRRPLVLLPREWRHWTHDERHAVLAHEIAHVCRRDFPSWLIAQFGVALHFCNPLVHWLAARLHLQQELAADAAAADILGDRSQYMKALAAIALRQAPAPVPWPARTFLPSQKTLSRRIEMLCCSKPRRSEIPRSMQLAGIGALLLAAFLAAGFRQTMAAGGPSEAAKIGQSMNNLRILALAMHNFERVHKHLPPAVVIGSDGKTPHSWRVELLPFLDQKALYKRYQMDEPWDSPANKRVLEQMPEVLRSPFDDPTTTNSGYYVIVGPGTVFESKDGVKLRDITDGTSWTILVVESKREIPWTKPEDIRFDPDKPLPELGGFVEGAFVAAFADGSARRFDLSNVKDRLKWFIMRNDGHKLKPE